MTAKLEKKLRKQISYLLLSKELLRRRTKGKMLIIKLEELVMELMEAGKHKIIRILSIILIIFILYYLISLLVFKGDFIVEHYYSYNSKTENRKNGLLISDKLDIKIEGDSLLKIHDLDHKFYLSKSTYQKFYGFLISIKNEDNEYRRISWEEPTEMSKNRNWIIRNDGEYKGEAFYSGHCDAKIGDTLILSVENPKTDYKIGYIKMIVK
jgi:hypothetical protein